MTAGDSTIALSVVDSSQPGEVRRFAVELAEHLGFDETQQGKVAIVATELATNLVRHSAGGEILLQPRGNGVVHELQIVALDRGPGIENIAQSLSDGYSTAGTSGSGMGAVKRLSTSFDLFSAMGLGTAAVARLHAKLNAPLRKNGFEIGAVSVRYPGETVCGDAWACYEQGDLFQVMVADGLGHGPLAAEASRAAVRIFHEHSGISPVNILQLANQALQSTRGAAMAVAQIDRKQQLITYAGVGNIAAMAFAQQKPKNLVSSNGTVGMHNRKPQSFEYPWTPQTTLLMFSDGLTSHLRIDQYVGLLARDPTMIAAVLYRDFKRGKDDATVVVVQEREECVA